MKRTLTYSRRAEAERQSSLALPERGACVRGLSVPSLCLFVSDHERTTGSDLELQTHFSK